MAEYRIDELAQRAGTTVRNIRSYQDRGLLPSPRLKGRVGLYDDAHLARLRLIGQMLERGYTLNNISDLIGAWEAGRDVGEVLGLEQVLTDPWTDEIPGWATFDELLEAFGRESDPDVIEDRVRRAIELGFVEPDGDRFRVPSPRLLHVGAELVASGIPLEAVLDIADEIRRDCEVIANRFVDLVDEHVLKDADLMGKDAVRVAEVIRRMRPLVQMVVNPFVARGMERRVHGELGDKLGLLLSDDKANDTAV
ncbi:MerR family transcriptional regulator [Actinocorallia sp. API 0066]|uniref:MerR family transcriptional regulator n=1 Tax=Actinocorallia sp. API 0066 TaxID=2896846 RepID=UPI001E55AF48|nr:MerR family transcriptional regulator [Actinocorallia sp. API 0066]MCD0452608.1 MerR family transcriptional regulator [Actinocorallia sp. API 0066]